MNSYLRKEYLEIIFGYFTFLAPGYIISMEAIRKLISGRKTAMNNLTLNNGVQMPMVGFGTWDVRGEKGKRCIQDAWSWDIG